MELPPLLGSNSVDKNEGETKGQMERGGNRTEKENERRRKRKEKKMKIFLAFRRSKLDGPGVKVDPCNEGYSWVPKSWSFVKLHEVGNFPTWVISSPKAI